MMIMTMTMMMMMTMRRSRRRRICEGTLALVRVHARELVCWRQYKYNQV
jgi:hypothetical protein